MTPRESAVLRGLLPAAVGAYEVEITTGDTTLRSFRQREFDAGRACAHAALRRTGVEGSVGRHTDRSPAWPRGATGSIAHCRHLAVAVSGPDRQIAGIGVDVEDESEVHTDLTAVVLTDSERARLGGAAAALLPLVFSMKETAYKCWYPLTGVALDFVDIEVAFDVGAGTFRATMVTPSRGRPMHVPTHGRFVRHHSHVYAATWIEPQL